MFSLQCVGRSGRIRKGDFYDRPHLAAKKHRPTAVTKFAIGRSLVMREQAVKRQPSWTQLAPCSS